jgi:hypothetical protein
MTARKRRTKARMTTLRRPDLRGAGELDHPQSVRHLFYRMTDPRLAEPVGKSEAGYVTVQRLIVAMRREGIIPYGWITDATRRGYFTDTWNDPADAVAQIAGLYRRSYWAGAAVYVEVWCESRSIAGVIRGECERHAVPLYPAGGFASLTLTWEAARNIAAQSRGPARPRPLRRRPRPCRGADRPGDRGRAAAAPAYHRDPLPPARDHGRADSFDGPAH